MRWVLSAALVISACGQAAAAQGTARGAESAKIAKAATRGSKRASTASATANAKHRYAKWAGRYVGQEGLFVVVRPTTPGKYSLEMMGDDPLGTSSATFTGVDTPSGIAFERNGVTELLRRGTADEINLKYVEGNDCLMVKEFEGFCRQK